MLVHQGEVPPLARLGPGERVAHHALDPEAGVDADLGRDLGRGADAQGAAVAGVGALGALAHDDEVDATGGDTLDRQRAGDPGVEPGRAQVDEVVQGEPQPQQQAALEDATRHAGVADRAEQDGVVAADLLQHRVGQRLAGRVPAPGAQVVLGGGDLGSAACRHRRQDLEPLGDHLRADAVPTDDRDVERLRRVRLNHGPTLETVPRDGTAVSQNERRPASRRASSMSSGEVSRPCAPGRAGPSTPAAPVGRLPALHSSSVTSFATRA